MSPVAAASPHVEAYRELSSLFTRYRDLAWEMTKREVTERYAGQHVGHWWALAHPIVLTAVYIFLFGFVFNGRIREAGPDSLGYIAYLLSGLIPWLAFQESMSKGAVAISSNNSIVKQVVFPLQILPIKGVLAALFTQGVMTTLFGGYLLATHQTLPATWLLLPVLWAAQGLAMCGVAFVLSAAGAFVRDIKDIVQISAVIGTYLAPIAYRPDWVPRSLQPILYANPFSYMVWAYQDAAFHGSITRPWAWGAFLAGSAVVFWSGYLFFRRVRPYFGNVL